MDLNKYVIFKFSTLIMICMNFADSFLSDRRSDYIVILFYI